MTPAREPVSDRARPLTDPMAHGRPRRATPAAVPAPASCTTAPGAIVPPCPTAAAPCHQESRP